MEANHPEAFTVTLGGEARTLRLSMAAFRLAQLRHGTTVTLSDLAAVDLTLLPRLVWIALLPENPAMTEEEALMLMANDPEGEGAASRAVLTSLRRVTALIRQIGDEGGEGKAEPTP